MRPRFEASVLQTFVKAPVAQLGEGERYRSVSFERSPNDRNL